MILGKIDGSEGSEAEDWGQHGGLLEKKETPVD